jgi:hypothetical protein
MLTGQAFYGYPTAFKRLVVPQSAKLKRMNGTEFINPIAKGNRIQGSNGPWN